MVQFSGLSGEQALAEVYDLTGMKVFSGIYHTEDGTLNEKTVSGSSACRKLFVAHDLRRRPVSGTIDNNTLTGKIRCADPDEMDGSVDVLYRFVK